MSNYHRIKVNLKAYDAGGTFGTVELDGKPLQGVRAIKIEAGYPKVTEVTLSLIASVEAEIDGTAVDAKQDGDA